MLRRTEAMAKVVCSLVVGLHARAMIATHVDDVPGVATSDAMIEFILGAIRVVYACEMVPWKKVLGFKITVNETDGTVQMSCEAVIETMYRTYLKGQLTYDAKLPMRNTG